MPFIGAILSGLARLFSSRIGQWVISAFVFLGISIAAQDVIMEPLLSEIETRMVGLPAQALAWVKVFKIDVYISIIASAYVTAAAGKLAFKKRAVAP